MRHWSTTSAVVMVMWLAGLATGAEGAGAPGDEPLRIGWPQLSGPSGNFEAPPERLVEDLSAAKVLWESECRDLGRAKGGSQAFRRTEQFTAEAIAKHGSHPGSWAGPVVADGVVFCASWRPSGEWVEVQGNKVRLDAEDFVVAIDALNGKTRWQTLEAGGILKGGGKRQGFQVGPVVHEGVVYSLGSTARLFAHDAATGKKLWESDVHPARPAEKKAREEALAGLAAGKFKYALTPNWCASLAMIGGVLIVPDQVGGLLGVDRKTGQKIWWMKDVISRWATPSPWKHEGLEYLLCGNEKGELRLIDPAAGRELWKLGGLGPNWFTLTPGRTHVLVNVVADSGKAKGAERKPGRLGAVKLSATAGEKAWDLGAKHAIPVWMDSGARIRVAYRDGRFLVPHTRRESGMEGDDAGAAGAAAAGSPAMLIEEPTGKVLSEVAPPGVWNEELSGLMYWSGDRVLSRADSFHGPTHGGRHPWIHWSVAGNKIARLPGKMDLGAFTNGYEVSMEAPLVGGLMFERTEKGTIVCYDLRAR